ncbi:MAG: xylulokinase [Cellulosilyticum sp.]|nr:xylulokinase [Cellulosilyticum sp.]
MEYLIGIDIGTSGTKTVLFDTEGNVVGSALKEYDIIQKKIGWAEQKPESWWKATKESLKEIIDTTKIDVTKIKGIGLSGQMHGLVLLDKEGQVIRDSIIWCDNRTTEEAKQIEEVVGRERLITITGNPAIAAFTLAKLMWVRNNEPDYYNKIDKVLLPKDYIRYKLTGSLMTEVSDASGMQMLDIRKRDWSEELLERLDINKDFLAKVVESHDITGYITEEVSREIGLSTTTAVVGGAGDQAAGAIGNGIVQSGDVSATIGSSGVVFAYTDSVVTDVEGRIQTFCHAIPNTWHVMGVTQGAGLSLKWYRDTFCNEEKEMAAKKGCDVYEILTDQAREVPAGSEGLMYLPYLMGERTPHMDPYASGVFFGVRATQGKGHMVKAIMEGVGYSLLDCLELIKENNIPITSIKMSGGGGKSDVWRQIHADLFDTEVKTISVSEGPALGVAILAGVGTGVYKDEKEACEKIIGIKSTTQPIEENVASYKKFYPIYKSLYKNLKKTFKEEHELLSEI